MSGKGMSGKGSSPASPPAATIGEFDPASATITNLNGYTGSGNPNGNMVISSANGITLGLKSLERYDDARFVC
jgi:hypothetical protein